MELSIALLAMALGSQAVGDVPAPDAPGKAPGVVHRLSEYGPLASPAQSREAYGKAIEALRTGGGVLLIPRTVWGQIKPLPLQGLVRTPPPPAETRRWKHGPGVTVVGLDEKGVVLQVPPMTGLRIERPIRLAEGDSLPHWGTHPAVTIDSDLVYGSSSYLDWLQAPVAKGADRRFYLPTIRGIRPGQFLNIHGGPGYGGGVTRACVKSLGYDADKRMPYLVADTGLDHVAGAIVHNKTNTGLIHMLQTSHNDNQTYDVKIIRNQYAHGDTYMYYCDFNYMSNVHSAAGDENGNCFGAFIRSRDNHFRATVESVDWQTCRLVFRKGAANVKTLGDSRPLVNRNPAKAITRGRAWVVPAEGSDAPGRDNPPRFRNCGYPTRLVKNPVTGVSELKMGGLIRGEKDCPWTRDVIGRYFALTAPGEKTPHGVLRWYPITALRENPDGTKDIEIRRFWWGAKSAGSPTLYRRENYSWDGHLRPLEYVIAPGTYVNDVPRAVAGGDRGPAGTLGLAPYGDRGTRFDFEPGDPVEQAIGPDPFKPQAFRVWMWEDVPGKYPAAVFDLANHGATSRFSAMTVAGGPASMEDVMRRHEQKPAWDNVLVLNSAAGVGINCRADFAEAAILFHQPNREQPIKWHYGRQEGKPPRTAVLTVSKATGEFTFRGGGIRANGPVSGAAGLSGEETPAHNLRGKNVPVPKEATSLRVRFAQPEADANYAVFVEQTWLTERAVSGKAPDGFTVSFAKSAPADARLDWMIVR